MTGRKRKRIAYDDHRFFGQVFSFTRALAGMKHLQIEQNSFLRSQ